MPAFNTFSQRLFAKMLMAASLTAAIPSLTKMFDFWLVGNFLSADALASLSLFGPFYYLPILFLNAGGYRQPDSFYHRIRAF